MQGKLFFFKIDVSDGGSLAIKCLLRNKYFVLLVLVKKHLCNSA